MIDFSLKVLNIR